MTGGKLLTLMVDSLEERRLLTLKRARKALEAAKHTPVVYELGGDVPLPRDPLPAVDGTCDCSEFVAWCLQITKRVQPCPAWLKHVNGGWYNTDGMWWDGVCERTGVFTANDPAGHNFREPSAGDVIVYPARWVARSAVRQGFIPQTLYDASVHPGIGHVGIISEVGTKDGKPHIERVIHCSAGNYRKLGTAIAETGPEVFDKVLYTATVTYHG